MVSQNSIDRTGGWGVRKNPVAAASIEQSQGTVAFPSTAPKAAPAFSATQPSIPNDLSKVVADLKHGDPDQYGLYTAYAGKPRKVKTTPFNHKIKGDAETQYNQPAPNMKGDDLLPADDGTPLRPSATLKKMGEAAKALADAPANAARQIELMRMHHDIMRIFHISERRPLNSDEIARVEEYARVIDRMLIEGPVRPPPQRDIINQDLLDNPVEPDILNQNQLDQLREEPAADFGHQFAEMYPDVQQQRELDHFDRERQRLMDQELSDDEGKYDEPHDPEDSEASFSDDSLRTDYSGYDGSLNTSIGSLGSPLRSISTLGSSFPSMTSIGSSIGSLRSVSSGSSVILPLRLNDTIQSAPSPLGDSSSASSTLTTRSAPATLSYQNEPTVKPPSPAGFDRIMGMFDALETRNPMAGETYTRPGLRKEDPPTPALVEQVIDKDLMFDALNVIKQRFNLRGKTKNNILAEIRTRPKSEAAKSLAALQRFAKNPSSSVADAGKSRRKIQEQWMRGHLKTKYPQPETRGRPRS